MPQNSGTLPEKKDKRGGKKQKRVIKKKRDL